MWVRGLKLQRLGDTQILDVSHPMWVRGLKQYLLRCPYASAIRRTPCGCVD